MEGDSTPSEISLTKPTSQNLGIQVDNSGPGTIHQSDNLFVVINQNNGAMQGGGNSSVQLPVPTDDHNALKFYLKNLYQHAVLPTVNWSSSGEDKIFKDYYIDMEQCDCTRKNIQKPMKLEEMFDSVGTGQVPTRILIESPPCFGKTCLSTKMAVDWANDEPYIKHFELVFLIFLRDLRGKTLDQELRAIIKNGCNPNFINENRFNLENVLLILDGFDEIDGRSRRDVLEVLYKVKFINANVLVTCRTGLFPLDKAELAGLFPQQSLQCRSEFQQKKVTLLGIAEDKRLEFLRKFSPNKPAEDIIASFKDMPQETKTILRSPLLLFLVGFFYDQDFRHSKRFTVTEIYKSLMNNIVRTSLSNCNPPVSSRIDLFDLSDKSSKKVQRTLAKFGIVCLDHLLAGSYSFEVNDFIKEVYSLGLLTKCKKKESLYSFVVKYDCFHLSFMEFSIAYSLWRQYMSNWIFNSIDEIGKLSQLLVKYKGTSMVYRFLSDLMDDKAVHLVRQLKDIKRPWFNELSMWREVSTSPQSDDIAQCIAHWVSSPVHLHVNASLQEFYRSEFHANILRHAILKNPSLKIRWHFSSTQINLPTDVLIPNLNVSLDLPMRVTQVIPQVQCKTFAFHFTANLCSLTLAEVEQCRNLFETVKVSERIIISIDCEVWALKPVETIVHDVLSNFKFYKVVVEINYVCSQTIDTIRKLLITNRIYCLKLVINVRYNSYDYLDEYLLETIVQSKSVCKLSVTSYIRFKVDLDLHRLILAKQWEKVKITGITLKCSESSGTHKCLVCKRFVSDTHLRSETFNGICPWKNDKPRQNIYFNCVTPFWERVWE